jgi:hypothetical protein
MDKIWLKSGPASAAQRLIRSSASSRLESWGNEAGGLIFMKKKQDGD